MNNDVKYMSKVIENATNDFKEFIKDPERNDGRNDWYCEFPSKKEAILFSQQISRDYSDENYQVEVFCCTKKDKSKIWGVEIDVHSILIQLCPICNSDIQGSCDCE